MIRKIVTSDNPVLRQKSKTVKVLDKKTMSLIKDMKETLLAQENPEGVGLAAVQVGKLVRLFVMRKGKKILTVINPKIVSVKNVSKKKQKFLEGCLSVPCYYSPLTRSQKLTLVYTNEKEKRVTEVFEGFEAQIVQHEVDHLDGIIFVDRILEKKLPLYKQRDDGSWKEVDF